MHLGNGAITAECVALTVSAASAGLGLCAWSARHSATRSKLGLAAGLGTFILAAQAVNVPILPGASAHLLGGVLLAWAVGPAVGTLTMAAVLVLQALLLGDGGIAALGANIVNMAIIPAALVAIGQKIDWLPAHRGASASPRDLAALSLVAGLAVVVAAFAIPVEVALFRSADQLAGWTTFTGQMFAVHLLIALLEAAATAALVAALAALASRRQPVLRPALAAAAIAALLGLVAVPLASRLPDGYEYAAAASGLADTLGE